MCLGAVNGIAVSVRAHAGCDNIDLQTTAVAVMEGMHMDLGAFSVSLAVSDLEASRRFYEQLGFAPFHGEATRLTARPA